MKRIGRKIVYAIYKVSSGKQKMRKSVCSLFHCAKSEEYKHTLKHYKAPYPPHPHFCGNGMGGPRWKSSTAARILVWLQVLAAGTRCTRLLAFTLEKQVTIVS